DAIPFAGDAEELAFPVLSTIGSIGLLGLPIPVGPAVVAGRVIAAPPVAGIVVVVAAVVVVRRVIRGVRRLVVRLVRRQGRVIIEVRVRRRVVAGRVIAGRVIIRRAVRPVITARLRRLLSC